MLSESFPAISWPEQVYIWRNDSVVCFVLDEHAEFDITVLAHWHNTTYVEMLLARLHYPDCLISEEHFADTKGVIRSCKSQGRQYNAQKEKDKSNDLQNPTLKTKD